jgi:hypothetical protein
MSISREGDEDVGGWEVVMMLSSEVMNEEEHKFCLSDFSGNRVFAFLLLLL